jgi:hypothetical protein
MIPCQNFVLSGASPNAQGTVAGTVNANLATSGPGIVLSGYKTLRIEATLQGATGGTLDVYVQVSYDGGVSWSDYVHFAQLLAGAAAVTYGVSMSRSNGDALAVVGKNTTPLLAAGDWRDGEWGNAVRLLFVAGAGTSAGATQTVKFFLGN